MTTSAARLPDRTALSNVAGNPVAVQSPARTRLSHCVRAAGRLAFSSGVATKVARRSRTICHGGSSAAIPVARDTSCQIVWASIARGTSIRRSALLIVTDSRPANAKIHSVVPLMMPSIGGTLGGTSMRKWALAMAR